MISVHLGLNSRVEAGFADSGGSTYMVVEDYGGVLDFLGITIDAETRPDGDGSYISVGMPEFVGFQQFGAVGVKRAPAACTGTAAAR